MPIVFLNEESTQLKGENKDYPDENGVKIIENEDYSKNNKENILESKISLAMVKGIEALSYHEIENLFMDSDFIIDVNLLKWIVYIIIFFCFFCIIGFCFCQNKKWDSKPSSCSDCRPAGRMAIHAMEARGFHSTFYSAFINISSLLHKSSLPLHSQSPYLCQPKPEGALERCQCQALHSISEWLSLLRTGFHGQNTFCK